MEPIFNEKIDKKWNLWVRKQYICTLFTAESQHLRLLFNRNTPKRVKKKKRSLKTQTWNPNTHKMLKKHCQRSFHFSSSTLSLSLSSPS